MVKKLQFIPSSGICDVGPYRFTPFSKLYEVHENMIASYIIDDNGHALFKPESCCDYFRDVSKHRNEQINSVLE
jgi:hypothetical protein